MEMSQRLALPQHLRQTASSLITNAVCSQVKIARRRCIPAVSPPDSRLHHHQCCSCSNQGETAPRAPPVRPPAFMLP
eukprot:2674171-Rhodomonas_salina.3